MKPAWLGVSAILLLVVTACGTAAAQESPTPPPDLETFLKEFTAKEQLRAEANQPVPENSAINSLEESALHEDLLQRIEALESEVKRLQYLVDTNLAASVVPSQALSQAQCQRSPTGGALTSYFVRGCYASLYADTFPRNYPGWGGSTGSYYFGLLGDEYRLSQFHGKHDTDKECAWVYTQQGVKELTLRCSRP